MKRLKTNGFLYGKEKLHILLRYENGKEMAKKQKKKRETYVNRTIIARALLFFYYFYFLHIKIYIFMHKN